MSDILDQRNIMQNEEFSFRAGVSGGTFFRLGQAINHVMFRQYDTHAFKLNQFYAYGKGTTGVDGFFTVLFNMELIAISFFNKTTGTLGQTIVDLHWFSAPGVDEGSIFSTRPQISIAAANNTYGIKGIDSKTSDVTATGVTLPVLTKTTFDAGTIIRMDLDDAMHGAQDFSLNIHFRPI